MRVRLRFSVRVSRVRVRVNRVRMRDVRTGIRIEQASTWVGQEEGEGDGEGQF